MSLLHKNKKTNPLVRCSLLTTSARRRVSFDLSRKHPLIPFFTPLERLLGEDRKISRTWKMTCFSHLKILECVVYQVTGFCELECGLSLDPIVCKIFGLNCSRSQYFFLLNGSVSEIDVNLCGNVVSRSLIISDRLFYYRLGERGGSSWI